MKTVLIISLLFVSAVSAATMSPPAIEWERLFPSPLLDVWETSDGNYIIGSYDSLFLIDPNGDIAWVTSSSEIGWYYIKFQVLLPLPDGGFLATGVGKELVESSYTIPIIRLTANGDALWTKSYGYNGFTEYAFDATELPDGGYAFAARKGADAWILRTDSQGDTLWTREWGWIYNDKAVSILYTDSGLTVLMQGRLQTTSGGPHLVRYDLDGNLLWETELDLPHIGPALHAQEMCEASDNGLLILDNYHPAIYHTDYSGYYQWHFSPPGWGSNYGWSVSTTMDGGILFGGENAEYIPSDSSKTELSGMISRHDSQGNELWRDYVYNSGCVAIYSARQLSQGGYIAAGKAWSPEDATQGFLIKYAPETGIESGDIASITEISELSPNPFSAALGITFNLPSEADVSITVYDLAGRVAGTVAEGVFPAGISTVEWVASEELSSGCYLVRFDTADGCSVRNCVLLR